MDTLDSVALSMGAAWASGINLYAAIFMLGCLGITGYVDLPAELKVLQDPLVLGAAGVLYLVEFFADKTPGVDSAWDALHSFIRIPAGAALAVGAVGPLSPSAQLAALLAGGSLAASTHATKAGGRLLINTSPEPVSNWTASIGEDLLVIGGLWTALHYPIAFLVFLAGMVALMIWLLPRTWRALRRLGGRLTARFHGGDSPAAASPGSDPRERAKKLPSPAVD